MVLKLCYAQESVTNERMDKPEAICPLLFQRWGHKETKMCLLTNQWANSADNKLMIFSFFPGQDLIFHENGLPRIIYVKMLSAEIFTQLPKH